MKIGPKNGAYDITIPDTWKFEDSDASFDIYKDPGVGAISISDYIIPPEYNFVEEHELLDFLKSVDDPPSFRRENIQYHSKNLVSAELIKEGKYFKVWLYYKDRYAVFITYVCDEEDKNIEKSDVEQIVSSLNVKALGLFQ
jgi:hypothetical protein